MKARSFVVALAAILSAVTTSAASAAMETLRFEIEGQTRRVQLHLPDVAGASPPSFVIVFHGLGDDNVLFADAVQFHKEWPGAIVAYPNGEVRKDRSSKRGWQTRIGQYDDRDLQLVDKLLAEVSERYGTRAENTHAAGFSNGGHMVFLLMSTRPQAFASFAVVGSVRPDLAGSTTPKPLMYLFGKNENRKFRDEWAGTIEAMVAMNRTAGPLRDYAGCCKLQLSGTGGAPFAFGLYNAGHVWPHRGNEWIKRFFTEDLAALAGPEAARP